MKKTSVGLLFILLWSVEVAAQTPYYQGKTIRVVVGYPAGSAHDLWARLIAPQLTKHIPGNPATIVQIMSGAGSMTATNYIYSVSKPDGLTLGVNNAALYFEQLLKKKEVQYDWSKFAWVGSTTPTSSLLYMWANTPYKTIHDVRNVMVEGVSGLLAVHPAHERPVYEPSKRRITWKNGAVAEMFSADETEGLRGPQFSAAWCDEMAKWRGAEAAWDMLQFGLRLGDNPQVVVTTTPRSSAFLKKVMNDPATVTTHLQTASNVDNLAPAFLAEMTRRYAGSVLGRQELLGEIVEDSSESLWRRSWIEEKRVERAPEMRRVVVALDPPVSSTARSDACGIIVAGLGVDGRAYVLADRTIQGRTPDVWAKAAIAAYDDFAADRMVAEVNQGGDLVTGVVQQFRAHLPIAKVRATRGKWVRAEPVASLYAEGRVVHVGRFDALEDQLVAFGIDGTVRGKSPDRADALVWAVTELMLSDAVMPSVRML